MFSRAGEVDEQTPNDGMLQWIDKVAQISRIAARTADGHGNEGDGRLEKITIPQ
jgi:hypothetical protein